MRIGNMLPEAQKAKIMKKRLQWGGGGIEIPGDLFIPHVDDQVLVQTLINWDDKQ